MNAHFRLLLLTSLVACGGCTASGSSTAGPATAALLVSAQKVLQERLRRNDSRARSMSATIRVEVMGDGGGVLFVDPSTTTVLVDSRPAPVTIHIDGAALLDENSNAEALMMEGKFRIKGDMAAFAENAWIFGFVLPGESPEYKAALDRANLSRAALFERWGALYPLGSKDLRVIPLPGTSMPNWPMREQYALLQTGATTIIASDGLSNPSMEDPSSFTRGYGFELWAETDEKLKDPTNSWLKDTVQYVCRLVTESQLGRDDIARLGMMSLEIPTSALHTPIPPHMVTTRGTVGALLGATANRPEQLDAPLEDVRYYNIRLLSAEQTEELMKDGIQAIKRLASLGTVSRVHKH